MTCHRDRETIAIEDIATDAIPNHYGVFDKRTRFWQINYQMHIAYFIGKLCLKIDFSCKCQIITRYNTWFVDSKRCVLASIIKFAFI